MCVLPQTVWQELSRRLMLAEAAMKHGSSRGNPAARLAERLEIICGLGLYQPKMRNLLGLGLRFESCTQSDLLQSAFSLQKRYGLLTNDSVVLVVTIIAKTLPGGGAELRC